MTKNELLRNNGLKKNMNLDNIDVLPTGFKYYCFIKDFKKKKIPLGLF